VPPPRACWRAAGLRPSNPDRGPSGPPGACQSAPGGAVLVPAPVRAHLTVEPMRTQAGGSLLEVLVALLVLGAALPAALVGVGLAHRETVRARARTAAALGLLSRTTELGNLARRDSACGSLAGGTAEEGPGVTVRWEVTGRGPLARVQLRAEARGGPVAATDSAEVWFRCD
jgi:type II secretory pathway pseudopilin PulG